MELYKSTEIEFTHEKNNPYRYHTTLTHFPTGWVITQVSERSRAETKNLCLKELKWRLKHKEDWELVGKGVHILLSRNLPRNQLSQLYKPPQVKLLNHR